VAKHRHAAADQKISLDPKAFLFIAVRSEARFPAFLSGSVGLLVL
jgi:hypothetical protein